MKIILTHAENEKVHRLYMASLEEATLPLHLKAALEIRRVKDAHAYSAFDDGVTGELTIEVEPEIPEGIRNFRVPAEEPAKP